MSFAPISKGSDSLAADARSLNHLKLQAGLKTPEAIQEAAKQFESLFMRELIKSMREATMKSGLLDSPGGDLGADMLDQQFAVQMSGRPGGLSELIAKQLTRQMENPDSGAVETSIKPAEPPISTLRKATSLAAYSAQSSPPSGHSKQASFVAAHSEAARKVAKSSGIPASFMLGQAAHETGWGKHEIKHADGSPSFNLFGIKASSNWTGRVAEITTTEYVDGVARKTTAKFRAYDSYEASFKDYSQLITKSPRYAQASQQTGSAQAFANSLQKAGYATDPEYAAKLGRAIHMTSQLQRQQA